MESSTDDETYDNGWFDDAVQSDQRIVADMAQLQTADASDQYTVDMTQIQITYQSVTTLLEALLHANDMPRVGPARFVVVCAGPDRITPPVASLMCIPTFVGELAAYPKYIMFTSWYTLPDELWLDEPYMLFVQDWSGAPIVTDCIPINRVSFARNLFVDARERLYVNDEPRELARAMQLPVNQVMFATQGYDKAKFQAFVHWLGKFDQIDGDYLSLFTAYGLQLGVCSTSRELSFEGCFFYRLPFVVSSTDKIRFLSLYNCAHVTSLPDSIFGIRALHTVDLTGCNKLTSLPDSFPRAGHLHVLNLSDCTLLSSLPPSLGRASNIIVISGACEPSYEKSGLTILTRRCNAITSLPDTFGCRLGQRYGLYDLTLEDMSTLTHVPPGVYNMMHLTIIRCGLTSIPDVVYSEHLTISDCPCLRVLPRYFPYVFLLYVSDVHHVLLPDLSIYYGLPGCRYLTLPASFEVPDRLTMSKSRYRTEIKILCVILSARRYSMRHLPDELWQIVLESIQPDAWYQRCNITYI